MRGSVLTAYLCLCAVLLPGCQESTSPGGTTQLPVVTSATAVTDSIPVVIQEYTGTLTGRVVYTGPPEANIVREKIPDKCRDKCPKTIPQDGWYTSKSTDGKGIRYVVVFLRPVGEKWTNIDKKVINLRGGTAAQPGQELVHVSLPHHQFEPRVSVVLPGQKLRGHNNGDPHCQHDFMLQAGSDRFGGSVPVGKYITLTLPGEDRKPYRLYCNQHINYMNGYV